MAATVQIPLPDTLLLHSKDHKTLESRSRFLLALKFFELGDLHRPLFAFIVGFLSSCLSVRAVEIIEIIDTPAPEFAVSGVIRSDDGTQILKLEAGSGDEVRQLSLRGVEGPTKDWEIPSWMHIRSVVFVESGVWFMVWCQKQGASLPVCLARCTLAGDLEDSLKYYDFEVDRFNIRRLVGREKACLMALGGVRMSERANDEAHSGRWLRLRLTENELREIPWDRVVEIWKRQMNNIP